MEDKLFYLFLLLIPLIIDLFLLISRKTPIATKHIINIIVAILTFIYYIIKYIYKYFYYIFALFIILAILIILFNTKMARYNPGGLIIYIFGFIFNPILSLFAAVLNVLAYLLEFPLHLYNTIKTFVLILFNTLGKITSFIVYIFSFIYNQEDELLGE